MLDVGKYQKDVAFHMVFRHYSNSLFDGVWLNWFLALCFCYVFG